MAINDSLEVRAQIERNTHEDFSSNQSLPRIVPMTLLEKLSIEINLLKIQRKVDDYFWQRMSEKRDGLHEDQASLVRNFGH